MLQFLRRLIGCSCEAQAVKPGADLEKASFAAEIDRATERIRIERERQDQVAADLARDVRAISNIDPVIAAVVRRLKATNEHLVLSGDFSSLSPNETPSEYSRIILDGKGLQTAWNYSNQRIPSHLQPVTSVHLAAAGLTIEAVIKKIHVFAKSLERDPLPKALVTAAAPESESPYLCDRRSAND